jgi:hypothetical protein
MRHVSPAVFRRHEEHCSVRGSTGVRNFQVISDTTAQHRLDNPSQQLFGILLLVFPYELPLLVTVFVLQRLHGKSSDTLGVLDVDAPHEF